MFLKHLRQKPDKMAPFENNNKPCKVFNHNKESKGRPIYFSFYTFQPDLNAACRCLQFVPAASDLWGESLESPAFLQHGFSRLMERLVAGRGVWRRVRCEVWVGAGLCGTCPGASPAALSVAGGAQAELSATHRFKVTCLKQSRETRDV